MNLIRLRNELQEATVPYPPFTIVKKGLENRPYYYKQWSADGKTRSLYLGKEYPKEIYDAMFRRRRIRSILRKIVIMFPKWLQQQKTKATCSVCGESDHRCLEFHHKDRSKKGFAISLADGRRNNKLIEAEMAKCIVLCANCHKKHHSKERSCVKH